ncbi:unnamed protein product, partial [marine sediment metagenome]
MQIKNRGARWEQEGSFEQIVTEEDLKESEKEQKDELPNDERLIRADQKIDKAIRDQHKRREYITLLQRKYLNRIDRLLLTTKQELAQQNRNNPQFDHLLKEKSEFLEEIKPICEQLFLGGDLAAQLTKIDKDIHNKFSARQKAFLRICVDMFPEMQRKNIESTLTDAMDNTDKDFEHQKIETLKGEKNQPQLSGQILGQPIEDLLSSDANRALDVDTDEQKEEKNQTKLSQQSIADIPAGVSRALETGDDE